MPVGVSAYVPLANVTLSSSAASVTFSSINQGFRDLVLVVNASAFYGGNNVGVEVNGNTTAANYSTVSMEGNGSTTFSGSLSSTYARVLDGLNWQTISNDAPSTIVFNFFDYSATDKNKTVLVRANRPGNVVAAAANRFNQTSQITSLKLMVPSDLFAADSTFALYGVSA